MKNRDYKTLVAIATSSALVVGSLGVVAPSYAKDDKNITTETVENTVPEKTSEAASSGLNQKQYMQKSTVTETFLPSPYLTS